MGGSWSSPDETRPTERTEDGGWLSWLSGGLCGAPSNSSGNEADTEQGERRPLRSAELQRQEDEVLRERSALEEKKEQLRQKNMREEELCREIQQLRVEQDSLRLRAEKRNQEDSSRRIRVLEMAHEEHLRSAQQKEAALNERLNELSRENQRLRSAVTEREQELRQRLEDLTQEILQLRSDVEQKDTELRQSRQRICVQEKVHEESLRSAELTEKDLNDRLNLLSHENQQLRSALDLQKDELRQRTDQRDRLQEQLRRPSSCRHCELQAQEHRQTMSEMEAFYKDKLTESRSALKEKEEQLSSFKDRVAQNVVLSLKTDNTENMNCPVNQTRLTEMYQQLRVCTWPNIHYTSADKQPRTTVQEAFAAAENHIEALKTSMKKLCDFRASPKVEKFRLTALENLQLALYHSSKQDVFQAAFPQFCGGSGELQLASECYWLGCLMELHSPPLHPHWDSTDEDSKTVFPRELRSQRHQNK